MKVVSLRAHQAVQVLEVSKTVDKFGLGGDNAAIAAAPITKVADGFEVVFGKSTYFIPSTNVRYARMIDDSKPEELTGEDESLTETPKKTRSRKKNASDSE